MLLTSYGHMCESEIVKQSGRMLSINTVSKTVVTLANKGYIDSRVVTNTFLTTPSATAVPSTFYITRSGLEAMRRTLKLATR